jgi:hypothetical protein
MHQEDAVDGEPDSGQPHLEDLVRQVSDLQQRVRALERLVGAVPEEPPAGPDVVARFRPEDTAKVVPLVGRALLGIAGAYLLRALTEFGLLPLRWGVAAGILYALAWLVLAARTARERRLAAAIHGVTSVLILMPLLWETLIRFHAISSHTAAGVLVLFCAFGLAISWRKNLSVIASTTTLAGVVTAAALLMGTLDLVPFTIALLAVAAVVEVSACLDHWLGLRWVVALVADLAVLLLMVLVTRPRGLPEGYAPIAQAAVLAVLILLLAIYLSSTIARTLWRHSVFAGFEVAQCVVAFLVSIGGALRLFHGDPAGVRAVALFTLAGGAACYFVSFRFLERAGKQGRNFYVYSTFGLLLAFAGSRILVSGTALAVILSALALVCLRTGKQADRMTLKWHGTLYLLLAAALSGLTAWAAARLLGAETPWVWPGPAAWIGAGAALVGYVMAWRSARTGDWPWPRRLVVLLIAANCAFAVAGMAAGALVALCGGLGGPTLRTAVLTLLSVAMAWSGTRWPRFELVWLVYPFMTITAYKLLAQDFVEGQTLTLFVSLFLYGGALVLLPRILQKGRRE